MINGGALRGAKRMEDETSRRRPDRRTVIILGLICCRRRKNPPPPSPTTQGSGIAAVAAAFSSHRSNKVNSLAAPTPSLIYCFKHTPSSPLASSVLPRPLWLVSPPRQADTLCSGDEPELLRLIYFIVSIFSPPDVYVWTHYFSLRPLVLNSTFGVMVSVNEPTFHHRCRVAVAD